MISRTKSYQQITIILRPVLLFTLRIFPFVVFPFLCARNTTKSQSFKEKKKSEKKIVSIIISRAHISSSSSWFNWKVWVESARLEVVRDDKWSGIIRNNAERVVYLPPFISSSRLHRAILRPFPRTISQVRQHYAPPFCRRHVTRYFLSGSFIVDETSSFLPLLCFVQPFLGLYLR